MFKTMIEPKMNGTVTSVRNAIGLPRSAIPIVVASAAPISAIVVHTRPRTGCFMIPGDNVSGQRSKHSTRNMTASAVT